MPEKIKTEFAPTDSEETKELLEKMYDDYIIPIWDNHKMIDVLHCCLSSIHSRLEEQIDEGRPLSISACSSNIDLSKYGFAKGTNTKNLMLLMHMFNTDTGGLQAKFINFKNAISDPKSSGITASASLKKIGIGRLFGDNIGLLIKGGENSSYPAALYTTIHSNLYKTDQTYSQWVYNLTDYTKYKEGSENWYHAKARTFIKNNFIEEMKNKGIELNDKEYAKLVEQLPRHFDTMKDVIINGKTIGKDIIKESIIKSEETLTDRGKITEVLVNQPEIQGFVVGYDLKTASRIHPSLVFLANKYNIPIFTIN